MRLRGAVVRGVFAGAVALAATLCCSPVCAQSSVRLIEPPVQLLPPSFAGWKLSASGTAAQSGALSLTTFSKQALEECGPQRSVVEDFARAGRTIHVEAVEFGDRTGALSAFTLVEQPGMKPGTDVGSADAVGDGAVLFTVGDTLVLVSPATEVDLPALRGMAKSLPKVTGSQGIEPLLPSLIPAKDLVRGSMRYALGPATYAAEGGVLPANSLGWDKSAEAVTARYDTRHGTETLTLLLYPTPQIAQSMERALNGGLHAIGPSFATAKLRRENELVMVATGRLTAGEAQGMLEDVHLRQEATIDRYMPPVFTTEVQKTFSLLENIVILFCILAAGAVLLGLFLGGGRALIRVMQGKPAATEPEFLSLHLAAQNPAPHLDAGGPRARS
jgi:hypothetical protein